MDSLTTRCAVELSGSFHGYASLRGLIDQIAVWTRKIDRDAFHLASVRAKHVSRKFGRVRLPIFRPQPSSPGPYPRKFYNAAGRPVCRAPTAA
jgi:hypothetical protein